MSYRVGYKAESVEDLEKLDSQIQSRIVKKILWLAENFAEITPLSLSGNLTGFYKLRVGDYRILYEFSDEDETITILKVGHRSEIYD